MRLFCFTQISVDAYLETEPNLHKRLQVHAQFFDKRESILDKSLGIWKINLAFGSTLFNLFQVWLIF